jgi:TolB-like protein
VTPFENGGSYGQDKEDFDGLRKALAGMLISELSRNPAVRLVDRADVQRMLDDQGPGVGDRVDAATAAKVGKLAGAQFVITGSFIDLYGDFRLDARLISVATGEILKAVRSDPKLHDRRDMFRMIQSVAGRILADSHLPPAPAALAQQAAARPVVPTEALAFYGRALLYHDRGNMAKAVEYYQKALGIHPAYAEASEGLRKAGGRN